MPEIESDEGLIEFYRGDKEFTIPALHQALSETLQVYRSDFQNRRELCETIQLLTIKLLDVVD